MNPFERRQKLLEKLCQRRHDTYDNLADEFHVSKMTIRRDVAELMCSYPIETVRGGHHGGVWVVGNYPSHRYRQRFTPKQAALIRRLGCQLTGDDLETLNEILLQFAP